MKPKPFIRLHATRSGGFYAEVYLAKARRLMHVTFAGSDTYVMGELKRWFT